MCKPTGAGYSIFSREAKFTAERLYENIRNRKMDCYKISKCTNFSVEQVQIIKNYIFKDSHWLFDNGKYKYERFYPSYAIAESWRRLAEGKEDKLQKHDVMLLYHELTEIMLLLQNPGYTQDFAHELANKRYNYQVLSDAYYQKLGRL